MARVAIAGPMLPALNRSHTTKNDSLLARFIRGLHGPHPIRTLDVEHYGFTDFALLNRQARQADPALGGRLEQSFTTGTADSTAAGRRAVALQRTFVASFLDRYLGSPPPPSSCAPHPECLRRAVLRRFAPARATPSHDFRRLSHRCACASSRQLAGATRQRSSDSAAKPAAA